MLKKKTRKKNIILLGKICNPSKYHNLIFQSISKYNTIFKCIININLLKKNILILLQNLLIKILKYKILLKIIKMHYVV